MDFGAYNNVSSLWVYRNNSTWTLLHPLSPAHLAAGDIDGNGRADLVMDFRAPFYLWTFRNNTTWVQLPDTRLASAEDIVLTDRDGIGKDAIVIDFGPADGNGLWQYTNEGGWRQLHALSPELMVTGQFY
jgi:hypothetical protein